MPRAATKMYAELMCQAAVSRVNLTAICTKVAI